MRRWPGPSSSTKCVAGGRRQSRRCKQQWAMAKGDLSRLLRYADGAFPWLPLSPGLSVSGAPTRPAFCVSALIRISSLAKSPSPCEPAFTPFCLFPLARRLVALNLEYAGTDVSAPAAITPHQLASLASWPSLMALHARAPPSPASRTSVHQTPRSSLNCCYS